MPRRTRTSKKRQRVESLKSRRFGCLLIMELASYRKGKRTWTCRCICGKKFTATSQELLSGDVTSCGEHKLKRIECKPNTKKLSKRKRRQLVLDAEWTKEMEAALHQMFNACVVCGRKKELTTDHVLPLARGFGLVVGNAVVLCAVCNGKKGSTLLHNLPEDMAGPITKAAAEFRIAWERKNGVVHANT